MWRGSRAWALWVVASALGGFLGGTTAVLGFLGPIFFFGPILGYAQGLVLERYLTPRESGLAVVVLWVSASLLGNFVGWMAVGLLSEASTSQALLIVTWAVLAAFQGAALALVASPSGHPRLAGSAVLWVLAGVVGGAPAVLANAYVSNASVALGGQGGPDTLVPLAMGSAAAGAIYGAATGLVLAAMARRS